MSAQALQEDQLLELLMQLKKTTPEQARTILNSQPQIAFALMAVMVNISAVNMDVVQTTLAAYGALPGAPPASQVSLPIPPAPVTSPSAIPPHLAASTSYRSSTPTYSAQPPHLGNTPTYSSQPPPSAYPPPGYGAPPSVPGPSGYAQPVLSSQGMMPPGLPAALAGIPDDQKALIMRVISMSREEIFQLPYTERENIIKLRATLGLPT